MKNKSIIFGVFALLLTGAIFQSCEEEPVVDTGINYTTDLAPIMTNYCLTCHSGTAPTADLNLDNYANVRSTGESGKLISRIEDMNTPMPPSGLMPEEKRQKIQDWIDGGYQE